MKVKVKNKRPLVAIAILLALAGIGTTIAYHTSSGTFTNLFRTIFDQWTVTEEFVSPDNWQQCQRTPKAITATNTGNAPIGVRVKYEEYWKSTGNTSTTHESDLPLQIGGQNVALVNMNTSNDWELRDDGYYYYTRPLRFGETTSSVIDFVEYNCDVDIAQENNDCETINGATTCTKRDQYDYDNANYHLFATVEITDEPESYNITPKTTTLVTGADLNLKMKRIANPGSSFANTGVVDTSIEAIKMASALPENFTESWNNQFNASSSEPRVSGWFDNSTGTFYFYTEADYIEMNSDMGWAFQEFDSLVDISGVANWHASKVTRMNSLFSGSDNIADITPLANWDTSNNTSLNYAFYETPKLTNLNALANWQTGKVTEMVDLFYDDIALNNIDGLTDWDVSNVENMGWLFWGDSSIPNLNGLRYWNTKKATAINSAFNGLSSLTDISGLANWDTHNVVNMGYLMRLVSVTNLNALANWQTGNVQYLDNAFKEMPNLKDISGLENWDTSSVTTLDNTFYKTTQLRNIAPLAKWNTGNVTSIAWLLGSGGSDSNIYIPTLSPLKEWDVRKVRTINGAFYGLKNISNLDGFQNWQTDSLENTEWAFANMGDKLTDISQVANWNLSHLTTISRMFSGDNLVNGSSLNGWIVPSGTDTSYAFTGSNKPTWYQE